MREAELAGRWVWVRGGGGGVLMGEKSGASTICCACSDTNTTHIVTHTHAKYVHTHKQILLPVKQCVDV